MPMLVLGSEIEGAGVLEVWREDNGFVSSFPWELHTEIPRFERDKSKLRVV